MNAGRLWATTLAQLKMMFRRRIVLFWSLVFPIILMVLLGLLFGRATDAGTITVIDQAGTAQSQALIRVLERTDGVEVRRDLTDVAQAREDVKDGDRDALLVIRPASSGRITAELDYSNASATQAGILQGIVAGAADQVSIKASGSPTVVQYTARPVDSASLDYVDFLMPGVVALSIMISAVIGLATVLSHWRKRGILRRLKLTPMPLSEFLISRILASLVLTLLQVVVLVGFGALAFGIEISSTAWAAIPVALAGALCFLAMGFAVGSLTTEPETADAATQVITNPMMFLSGIFFPVSAMPDFVQEIAKVLPLYYMANGLRDTLVRGHGLDQVIGDLAILSAATVILAAVSIRTFRWE
jgi:ABC-2 type transport system permease protein